MNRSWIDPRLRQVQVAAVRSYLEGRGWRQQPFPRPELLVFELADAGDGQPLVVTLPSSERMRDYQMRLEELVGTLGEHEGRWAPDVVSDILAGPSANGAAEARADSATPRGA